MIDINLPPNLAKAVKAVLKKNAASTLLKSVGLTTKITIPATATSSVKTTTQPTTSTQKVGSTVVKSGVQTVIKDPLKDSKSSTVKPTNTPSRRVAATMPTAPVSVKNPISLLKNPGASLIPSLAKPAPGPPIQVAIPISPEKRNLLVQEKSLKLQTELLDKYEIFRTDGLPAVKRTKPEFERNAKNIVNDKPEMIFTAEYYVNDKLIGNLLCFEKFYDATHYEVWKKNLFLPSARYERILFIDIRTLKEETIAFSNYVKNVLGLRDFDENEHFLILDDQVKPDRIYQYRCKGILVPTSADTVDYDMILESKGLLNENTISQDSAATLFDYAGVTLGSKDLAWILALVNENLSFFGKDPSTVPLSKLLQNDVSISVPKSIDDVICILKESVGVFGLRASIEHLFAACGGLPTEFLSALQNSIDVVNNNFSFDTFRKEISLRVPVMNLVSEIVESSPLATGTQQVAGRTTSNSTGTQAAAGAAINTTSAPQVATLPSASITGTDQVAGNSPAINQLSKLDVILPNNTGTRKFVSITEVTFIFKYINAVLISVRHAQDNFDKLKEIRAEIEINRAREDITKEASDELRAEALRKAKPEVSPNVDKLYGIVGGEIKVDLSNNTLPINIEGVTIF